jgi:hypothetical protein
VATVVLSFTVQPNFEGDMKAVAVNVVPPGSSSDIEWSIRINGNILAPGFTNIIIPEFMMGQQIPFRQELLQGRLIELIATNSGALAVDVEASITGYTAFMSTWKNWGKSPISGIG